MEAATNYLHSWCSLEDLQQKAEQTGVLILENEGSSLIVGPLLHPENRFCCFKCYCARRSSNGANTLAPATRFTPLQYEVLRNLVDARDFRSSQIEISGTGGVILHKVIPIPDCANCQYNPLEIDELISCRTGIVHAILAKEIGGFHIIKAVGASTSALWKEKAFNAGISLEDSQAQARIRAIGECIERYSAAFTASSEHFDSSESNKHTNELKKRFPNIRSTNFLEDNHQEWVASYDYFNDKSVYLPSSEIFFPFHRTLSQSTQTSSGLAAGPSAEFAQSRAALELVERDVFTRAWNYQLPIYRIRPESQSNICNVAIENELEIPVVAAFVESNHYPYSAVGLAARSSWMEASYAATQEARLVRYWLESEVDQNTLTSMPYPPETSNHFAILHASQKHLRIARKRWLTSPYRKQLPSTREFSLGHLKKMYGDLFFTNLTTRDIHAAGLWVYRAFMPRAYRLDTNFAHRIIQTNPYPHPLM